MGTGTKNMKESEMIGKSKLEIPEMIFSLGVILTIAGCSAGKARPDKPHHTDWGFRNPGVPVHAGVRDFLRWRWERKWKKIQTKSQTIKDLFIANKM